MENSRENKKNDFLREVFGEDINLNKPKIKLPKTKKDLILKEWLEMPEYDNIEQTEPLITATFKFRTFEDFEEFKNIIKEVLFNGEKPFDGNQKKNIKNTWYPHPPRPSNYEY